MADVLRALIFAAGVASAFSQGTPIYEGPCLPACAAKWEECGRQGLYRACCNSEDVCVTKSGYYSQCRPLPRHLRNSFALVEQRACSSTLGLSKDNPLQGPLSLEALGAKPPPPAAPQAPLVKPYWLNLTDPIAANCSACVNTRKYVQEQNQPMFVYTDLCFLPQGRPQRARIRTNRGNDGPTDTTLFVVNEARTVTIWDDSGFMICSDGSEPAPRCQSGVCVSSPHDRCPLGVRLWSLSEVNLDLPPGSVPECFKVAVGTTPGLENVAKIGIDVLVDFVKS